MTGGISSLALALAIGEAVGLCLLGTLTFVFSPRRGRRLAEDVSAGVALGAYLGTLFGLCGWIGLELWNA
jgi:hypothetical protein